MGIETMILGTLGKAVFDRIMALTAENRLKSVIEEMDKEILHELHAHFVKLEARVTELAANVDDKQLSALIYRLWWEARGSTTNERRRMLAAAIAGYWTPDLDAEEKERITQIIARLQPSDIIMLRRLATGMVAPDEKYRGTVTNLLALEGAQCIVTTPMEWNLQRNEVTEVGRMVLTYLQDWEP